MNARVTTLLLLSLLLAAPFVRAQSEPLTKTLTLEARGGVTLTAPEWKQSKDDDAVAVLERAAEKDRSFAMLVVAVEEGPGKVDSIDWDRIQSNIATAARETGSDLTLELGSDFGDAAGWKGKRLSGILKANEREVAVEMIALVKEGVLVTVSVLGPKDGKEAAPLAGEVAKTAKAGTR